MTTPAPRRRRKGVPTTAEVIAAIHNRMRGHYSAGCALEFETARRMVQGTFGTNAKFAREWLRAALLDTEQDEFVWLVSTDNKWCYRVIADTDPDSVTGYTYTDKLDDDAEPFGPSLYLNSSGDQVADSAEAIRNRFWVVARDTLDKWITELNVTRNIEAERRDEARAAEDRETEKLIGHHLAMLRGMFAAAGIDPWMVRDRDRITAHAVRYTSGDKNLIRSRTTMDVQGRELRLLAEWLRDKGVTPVAERPQTEKHDTDGQEAGK